MNEPLTIECRATATAPVNHYPKVGTYGHVCRRQVGHDRSHLCACGFVWFDSDRAAFDPKNTAPMGRAR